MNGETVVDLRSVTKTYTMGDVEVHALRGVDLRVDRGDRLAIMGPSGSGKTTLLNLIGALDRPTSGKVIIGGTDITTLDERALTQIRREKISFIFQFFNLIPVLTAYENIEVPLIIANVEEDRRREIVNDLLLLLGLEDRADHLPDELSGGEQQRVAIARALAKARWSQHPVIILADEPTGDLDTTTGEEVVRALLDAVEHEHSTLILVTHDPEVAAKMDHTLEIRDGRVTT